MRTVSKIAVSGKNCTNNLDCTRKLHRKQAKNNGLFDFFLHGKAKNSNQLASAILSERKLPNRPENFKW